MKWFRLYHNMPNDPKWRLVSVRSGQPVGNILGVWTQMLCHASEAEDRGTLAGWDDEISAAVLGYAPADVAAIRQAMQGLVLDGLRLTGWDRRQRASDDIAARVKKHRTKAADRGPEPGGSGNGSSGNGRDHAPARNGHVTLHSADVTENPLRAQTPDSQKEKGGESSVTSESSAGAHAHVREDNTTGPPISAEIIPLGQTSAHCSAMVGDWVADADWLRWAADQGHPDPAAAAVEFRRVWLGKQWAGTAGPPKTLPQWRLMWAGFIDRDIREGRYHGRRDAVSGDGSDGGEVIRAAARAACAAVERMGAGRSAAG